MSVILIGSFIFGSLLAGFVVGRLMGRLGASAKHVEQTHQLERELAVLRDRLQHQEARALEVVQETADLETSLDDAKARLSMVASDLAASRAREEGVARELAEARSLLTSAHARLASRDVELAEARDSGSRLEAALEVEQRAAGQRLVDAERARDLVRLEIETLAQRMLEENGQALLQRSQASLEGLLNPLKERLQAFEGKVEKAYGDDSRDRTTLLERLRQMQETQGKLHADAEALTRALSGQSKAQGDWGEMVLERLLETAGLQEGREYELQVSSTGEDGQTLRPDVVISLPQGRAIVVDAKCSLTAFLAATRAESESVQAQALSAHLESIRSHVKRLGAKRYQELIGDRTLDVVLMFVPNEAAFHAALTQDLGLYEQAFRQGVVVCSPTTLLAALQLVGHVWRSEKQNTHARQIAEEAGRMLEKLAAFALDLDQVGARLDQAGQSWKDARARLSTGRGNVVSRAKKVLELGARMPRPEKLTALLEIDSGDEEGLGL
jgi:DNA recombination protein RmuC